MRSTSLTKFAASMRDPDPAGAKRVAAQLWQERGIIVIFPDQTLPGIAQMAVEAVAIQQYGKRGAKR